MTNYHERCLNTIIRDMEEFPSTALSASFRYYTRSEVDNLRDFLSTAIKEATNNLRKGSEFNIAEIRLQLNEVFVYESPYREHGNHLGDIDYMLYIVAEHLSEHANDIEKALTAIQQHDVEHVPFTVSNIQFHLYHTTILEPVYI